MMSPTRILVVDDDRSSCMILARILTRWGYQVDTTLDPVEALALVKENDYQLAVLDYQMPGMNGVDLYARMRSIRPNLPAIFETAYARIDVVFAAIEGGVSRVLAKPVDFAELRPAVEELVGEPS
jgi:two-component system, NtrC family, response regulator HydG